MFHVKRARGHGETRPHRFPAAAAIVAENVGKGKGELGGNSGKPPGILVEWRQDRKGERNVRELEERIRRDGVVEDADVLKVDSFLNHQMDVGLFRAMGREWARRFAGVAVEKAFQPGGDRIRARGVRVESLARIKSMSPGRIEFC